MSYMGYTGVNAAAVQIVPQASYTVTPKDVAGTIVITPLNAVWFSILMVADANYDGAVLAEYEDVTGAFLFNVITQSGSSSSIARADTVSFLNGGGGSWGSATGNTRPTVNVSGQMTLRIRVTTQATKGSCQVIIRYIT